MTTVFLLLQYTAQRPSDVLAMTWPQYSGTAIRLRQEKTKALLDVPTHPALSEYLDGLPRVAAVAHDSLVPGPAGEVPPVQRALSAHIGTRWHSRCTG